MVKKFSDEEFNAFLQKEFPHEADVVESALFSDEDFEDLELSDEEVEASYQRLTEKLKRDGIYREETTGETVRLEASGRKGKKRHSYSLARAAGFVVICVLGVFAASMTSEANRKYFIETMRFMRGDDTRLIIGNDETNEDVNENEYVAMERIEQELGVKMPKFTYRPMGLEFYDYEINTYMEIARIEYKFEDTVLAFNIDKIDETQASDNIGLHGRKMETIIVAEGQGNIEVDIMEIQDENDINKSYIAQWKLDDVYYQISGKIEKEELEKLIQYMKY